MHLKAMLLAITTAAALSASTASGAAVAPLTFAESGLGGGGFQNVIAIDPADSGLVLAGGDTSGIYRSLDWRHVARRVRCLLPLDRRIRYRTTWPSGRTGWSTCRPSATACWSGIPDVRMVSSSGRRQQRRRLFRVVRGPHLHVEAQRQSGRALGFGRVALTAGLVGGEGASLRR